MNHRKAHLIIGTLIIIFGIITLLGNLNIFPNWDHFLGGALLLSAAGFFYYVYQRDTSRWPLLLPTFVSAALGLGVILTQFYPQFGGLIGALFFFSLFAFFVFTFFQDERFWWAVIPAGSFFTLATLILVETLHLMDSNYGGVLSLSGMALTFFYLWGLKRGGLTFRWALWPAVFFIVLALIVLAEQVAWLSNRVLLSILLILIGGRLVLNTVKSRH
jgi:hypothetical protein